MAKAVYGTQEVKSAGGEDTNASPLFSCNTLWTRSMILSYPQCVGVVVWYQWGRGWMIYTHAIWHIGIEADGYQAIVGCSPVSLDCMAGHRFLPTQVLPFHGIISALRRPKPQGQDLLLLLILLFLCKLLRWFKSHSGNDGTTSLENWLQISSIPSVRKTNS